MADEPNFKEQMRRLLKKQAIRPGQPPADSQHFVVMNMSCHKDLKMRFPSWPFRHASKEAAMREAERQSRRPSRLGWRFGVYEYTGLSAKVEPAPVESVETESEMQAA